MIVFTFLLVVSLSISMVKNDRIISSFIDSKEVLPSYDANFEKLFLEMNSYRQREKDLNDTIDQILEDMETMRNYILHLEDTLADVASEATRNTKHIKDNADEIINVAETVSSVNTSLKDEVSSVNFTLSLEIMSLFEDVLTVSSQLYNVNTSTRQLIDGNKRDIEDNLQSITELSLYGQWCAFKDKWAVASSGSKITFDKIVHSNNNMNTSDDVLSVESVKYFMKC